LVVKMISQSATASAIAEKTHMKHTIAIFT